MKLLIAIVLCLSIFSIAWADEQVTNKMLSKFNDWALSTSLSSQIMMTHGISFMSGDEMKQGWRERHIYYTDVEIRLYVQGQWRELYTRGISADRMIIDNRYSDFLCRLPVKKENLANPIIRKTIYNWYYEVYLKETK